VTPSDRSQLTGPLIHSPYDAFYGLEVFRVGDRVEGTLLIAAHHLQPTGVAHGGIYAAIGEAVASQAANVGLAGSGAFAMGMTNTTSFVRPAGAGATLHAVSEPIHRGRTTWLVDVRISDDDGRLCATSRVTLAVRPLPEDLPAT
jgi:1,4-dihydroxy-2-naphthoyl-CoA hydrolase